MRRIRCGMAMSLDGFIAGQRGETDWITPDPEFDFSALWSQFDTLLMGRRTYEAAVARLGDAIVQGRKTIVVSRTLTSQNIPGVTIQSGLDRSWIEILRAEPGRDIWLMGGGQLFRSILELGEVDTLEVSVIPVLLGDGIPLIAQLARRFSLRLTEYKAYASGMLALTYEVDRRDSNS